jgi:hypothetical protein
LNAVLIGWKAFTYGIFFWPITWGLLDEMNKSCTFCNYKGTIVNVSTMCLGTTPNKMYVVDAKTGMWQHTRCYEQHTRLLSTTYTFAINNIHICDQQHTRLLSTTYSFAIINILVCCQQHKWTSHVHFVIIKARL